MYYFLGLTLKQDILNGSFWPSYILCQARTTSENRTGFRVIKQLDGEPSKNLPRVLVTDPFDHEELLDFLSVYQTQDFFKGVHYHPEGALCWYECNRYGDPTGVVIYARKVPIENLMWSFSQKKKFRMRNFSRQKTIQQVLMSEPGHELYPLAKPKLYQPKGSKHAKSKSRKTNKLKTVKGE